MPYPQADEEFSNRRMTRSASKRASGSLKYDLQQKKQRLSNQRSGELSEKKPEGGMSKKKQAASTKIVIVIDPEQQRTEGNDATEVRQSFALREYDRVQNKIWRNLTPEEWENYYKIVEASEGFDTVDLPDYIENYGDLIWPVNPSEEQQRVLEKCSESAIATFNKKNKTKYRFVKVIKATCQLVSGTFYYITFVAEDKDVSSTKKFQASVWYHYTSPTVKSPTVEFCRLEKPPKEVECNFEYVTKEEDPNKPKKPSSALFCFWEEFSKTFSEEHPNASDHAAGCACVEAWESMDEAARAPYDQMAEKKKAEYYKDLEAYKKRLASGWVEKEESDNFRLQMKDEDEDNDRMMGRKSLGNLRDEDKDVERVVGLKSLGHVKDEDEDVERVVGLKSLGHVKDEDEDVERVVGLKPLGHVKDEDVERVVGLKSLGHVKDEDEGVERVVGLKHLGQVKVEDEGR